MTYQFTVSPDFNPQHLPGWFIFNTWLQKSLDEAIHLEWYNDFASQHQAIEADKVDLIYANPFDATKLVRDKGFVPIACPQGVTDETIIAVKADHPAEAVEALQAGLTIATTDDPHVHLMGMMMLEPANLDKDNTTISQRDTYVLVAKDLLNGAADVGFFLEATYNDLSDVIRQQLRPIATSQIFVIRHVLMIGPRFAQRQQDIQTLLSDMPNHDKGQDILHNLGFTAWEAQEQEDTEFMIDLMDTLASD